ncbi:MAG: LysM peptidoglycan-binding domain-containing protein [Phycisphaerales bacterium]|jgi:nucleoid-associated protein YgaU|nr:LysM peptidoglycan-binding domain-containing protein [Phycisphaerales bacterium]MDP6890520.1 LysM peptidoglycan-binding domain-containing protein [Phycisphaerales bacterium]
MSIGGKFILLGAAVAVVLLVVIYGGGPVAVDTAGSPSVAAVVGVQQPVLKPATHAPETAPSNTSTRVARTASRIASPPSTSGEKATPSIEMGKPLSADLVAQAMRSPEASPAPTPPSVVEKQVTPPLSPVDIKVRSGDTLTAIAARTLGDGDAWHRFVTANPGIDPDHLRVGQILKIPTRATVATVRRASPPTPVPTTGRTHRIGEGDTLTSIASDYYGDSQRWSEIFEANRTALGGNPDRLRVNVVLVIP